MKKLVSAIFILTFVLFVAPSQSYAAWWDLSSWFSKNQQQPQNATSSDMASGTQIIDQGVGKVEQKDVLASSNNTKSSDAKTIEDLKAEVATLKTSLDSLEKRLGSLQNSTVTQPVSGGSDVAQRLTALEKRVGELPNPVTNDDTLRITKLEKKVAELSNISTNTGLTQAKNYDSQISEMAKRINALMHAGLLNDETLRCTLGTVPTQKGIYPACTSVYADLNY